jgi:amino acid adenylation domain-containing protein
MTDLAGALSKLSPDQRRALLAHLQRKQAMVADQIVPRRTGTGSAPLSFNQELLWLIDQLNPGNVAYNAPAIRRVQGALDLDVLQRVLDVIVARHEILRTTYALVSNGPVQVIHPPRPVELLRFDVRHLPEADREPAAREIIGEQVDRHFDLTRDLMLRCAVAQFADDKYLLIFAFHHIVTDGWSKEVLYRELKALYAAFLEGRPSPLAELPVQYADFAIWQRQWFEGERLEKHLAFWRRQLAGAPPLLELPRDRPRPAVQGNRGAHRTFHVSRPLMEALKALTQREGATMYIALLAAFKAFLHRLTGQEDILVLSPIAARTRQEVEPLQGYFSNAVVLRSDLSGAPTFRELLLRVRETALSIFEEQDFPFQKVLVELRPQRSLSFSPLVQIAFILTSRGVGDTFELPGATLSLLELDRGTSKFDLTGGFMETADGYLGSFGWNTDLFDEPTIARWQVQFLTLLQAMVASPDKRITDLPLLPEAQRRQLLVEWNQTAVDLPADRCVHHLIAEQAARAPEAVAVAFQGRQCTYRQLQERANQLGHYLRKLGVGPEVRVGVAVDGSLEAAVGLLGTLQAGGAYVPLDPAYPKERLAFMLQDSGVGVLLTQEHLAASLPEHTARAVYLDTDWPAIATESTRSVDAPVRPANLAYVMYTSGSTGQAKGVLVTHQGLLNHNLAAVRLYDLAPGDRVLQLASLSFDISVEEMFPTWLSGATVVFRPKDLLLGGGDFLGWLEAERITVLDLPTALWQDWVQGLVGASASVPASLRLVIVGGEKASAAVYVAWLSAGGDRVRWLNTYGPTETTVIATAYEPPAGADRQAITELPIGRPIANTQVYVLDRWLRPVPVGVPGELYIGGAGVARGYLGRPGLTGERFVPSPFGPAGARLYRTGDMVRFLPTGELEFLGRTDQQIKLRGFRIEPGEIETVLRRHPAVHEALVVLANGTGTEKRLVAYVTARRERSQPTDLRDFLKDRLPSYMLPTAVTVLDSFPLTSNGKIDRNALPHPVAPAAAEGPSDAAQRTPLEEAVAGIFAEVFGLERVGIHDDFFDLGGHSLLATRVVVRLRERFTPDVTLRDLFENATVARLSLVLLQRLIQETPTGP